MVNVTLAESFLLGLCVKRVRVMNKTGYPVGRTVFHEISETLPLFLPRSRILGRSLLISDPPEHLSQLIDQDNVGVFITKDAPYTLISKDIQQFANAPDRITWVSHTLEIHSEWPFLDTVTSALRDLMWLPPVRLAALEINHAMEEHSDYSWSKVVEIASQLDFARACANNPKTFEEDPCDKIIDQIAQWLPSGSHGVLATGQKFGEYLGLQEIENFVGETEQELSSYMEEMSPLMEEEIAVLNAIASAPLVSENKAASEILTNLQANLQEASESMGWPGEISGCNPPQNFHETLLWLAVGHVIARLEDSEEVPDPHATFPTGNIAANDLGATAPETLDEIQRRIRNAKKQLEHKDADSDPIDQITALGPLTEQLIRITWPENFIAEDYSGQVSNCLHNKFKLPNDRVKEKRFAQIAMALWKCYRHPVSHKPVEKNYSWSDAEFAIAAIAVLADLASELAPNT